MPENNHVVREATIKSNELYAIRIVDLSIIINGVQNLFIGNLEVKKGDTLGLVEGGASGIYILLNTLSYGEIPKRGNESQEDNSQTISIVWKQFTIFDSELRSFNPEKPKISFLLKECSMFKGDVFGNITTKKISKDKVIEILSDLRLLEILAQIQEETSVLEEMSSFDLVSRAELIGLSQKAVHVIKNKKYISEEYQSISCLDATIVRDKRETFKHRIFYKGIIQFYIESVLEKEDRVPINNSNILSIEQINQKIFPKADGPYTLKNIIGNSPRESPKSHEFKSKKEIVQPNIAQTNKLTEHMVIEGFLQMSITFNGANIPNVLRRLIGITRCILLNPSMVFVEDQTLKFFSHDTEYYRQVIQKHIPLAAKIYILSDIPEECSIIKKYYVLRNGMVISSNSHTDPEMRKIVHSFNDLQKVKLSDSLISPYHRDEEANRILNFKDILGVKISVNDDKDDNNEHEDNQGMHQIRINEKQRHLTTKAKQKIIISESNLISASKMGVETSILTQLKLGKEDL